MAYDYDVDILAALWTGAEDGEEPYASIIAANPTLVNEVSENRILSSIELLRSHMELLASRDEANILHFAISRLIRHTAGGSNPYSDDAKVTTAVGNVNSPTFPAGATLDITVDGTTVSPASATGGNCATVAAELNAILDAPNAAVVERRTTDTSGFTPPTLSGKYFTVSSANDATDYYAWFDVSAVGETTEVTTIGDSGGSLGGKYFTINSTGDAAMYYAWLIHPGRQDVSNFTFIGAFSSAIGAGMYDFDVTIDGGGLQTLTITLVGGETYSGIAALMSAVVVGGTVVYDDTALGFRVESSSTSSPSSVLVAAGTAGSGGGDLFAALDAADSVVHIFAAPVTAVDPAPGGLTGIEIPYTIDDGGLTMATNVGLAMTAHPDFTAFDAGGTAFITTATAGGGTTDAADVDTGFTVVVGTQGADASVDPAPGGLTALPISVSAGDSDSEIAATMRSDIGLNPDFFTEGAGTTVQFDNTATGPSTDAADVNTGLTITTTQQGADAAGDSVPVTAVCVQPGPRLAIQGQEDFVTFSIANGGGGIVGPAGIIPGERESTPKRVANEGRDAATGNIVGKLQKIGGL